MKRERSSWQRYLVAGLAANLVLWGLVLAYLRLKDPTYTSEWAVGVPDAELDARINIPEIGAATTESRSPYANTNRDPRENYKFIAQSPDVRAEAAARLDMSPEEFGRPRIEIIDNTVLMNFLIDGGSPERAQEKSFALYEVLNETIDELRAEESAQRNAGVQAALQESQQELEQAQQRLSDYKAETGLVSNEQLNQLTLNIEQLRGERAKLVGEQQRESARFSQLASNLDVSAEEASDAMTLSQDELFKLNALNYSEATAAINALSSQLGPNHPTMVELRTRQNTARAAMLERGSFILGEPVSESTITQLNLGGRAESSREILFRETVTSQVEGQGLSAQVSAIDDQIAELEAKLRQMAQFGATLDGLRRDVTIAEAVFSSNLTQLNVDQANVLGSYPQLQLVSEPSLPQEPSSPKTTLALLGGVLGTLLISSGMFLLWLRDVRSPKFSGAYAGGTPSFPDSKETPALQSITEEKSS